MTGRLASAVLVSAMLRQAEIDGGFGAVLHKGDRDAGSILAVLLEKGRNSGLWERTLTPSGDYHWTKSEIQDIDILGELNAHILRRRQSDPDLWVIELDVPDAERFTAQMPTGA
jgi:hypothetical protein